MPLALSEILKLVGSLDDTPGENTARERFRAYLQDSVKEAGVVRDYIEACINTSGPQYARSLQDLVNRCGSLLGFAVEFGRYQGTHTETGNDGLWHSPTGLYLVVEVKTTDAFAIETATLLGYIDKLIAEKKIPDRDHALGLYVVGRLEASLRQLTDSIMAQKLTHQLRVAPVDTILSLLELMEDVDLMHEEVLAILRPGGPVIDEIVKVLAHVAAQGPPVPIVSGTAVESGALPLLAKDAAEDSHLCLLTPVTATRRKPSAIGACRSRPASRLA